MQVYSRSNISISKVFPFNWRFCRPIDILSPSLCASGIVGYTIIGFALVAVLTDAE